MKKITLIITVLFFFLFSNISFGGYKERADRVLNAKKIIVYLWSKDQKFIKHGSTKDVKNYINFIDSLNDVTKLITENWFKDSKTKFEFKYIKDGGKKIKEPVGTVVMFISYVQIWKGQGDVIYATTFRTNSNGSDVSNDILIGRPSRAIKTLIEFKYFHTKRFLREVVSATFNNIRISEANFKTSLLHLRSTLKGIKKTRAEKKIEKKKVKDLSILKSKILYISKKDIHKNISMRDIKSLYPFKLKIVEDHKKFEKLIIEQKDAYFFIPKKVSTTIAKNSSYPYSVYAHFIYDFNNESFVGYSPVKLQGYFTASKTPFLTKKSFKRFMKKIEKSL